MPIVVRLACAVAISIAISGCSYRMAGPPRPIKDHPSPRAGTDATPPPAPSNASPSAPAEPEVVSLPVPGSSFNRTRGTVMVGAPIAAVRATLLDFAHYPEFLLNYRSARVVGPARSGGQEVAMEIDELGGMVKLRVKIAIAAPAVADGVETYEGSFVEGNVRAWSSLWRLEPVGEARTRLTLESHVDPDLPIPASFINRGSVGGLRDAILAIKARAERGAGGR